MSRPKHRWQGLKVQNLESWMSSTRSVRSLLKPIKEAFVIFNRDGMYYFKGSCWWEFQGKAYSYQFSSVGSMSNDMLADLLCGRELSSLQNIVAITTDKKLKALCEEKLQKHEFAVTFRRNYWPPMKRLKDWRENVRRKSSVE